MPNSKLRSLEGDATGIPTGLRAGHVLVRGRPSSAMLDDQVREALRFLDDPIALEGSSLTRLPAVRDLSATKYRGRTCATGLALRQVLRESLDALASDLEGTPVGALAAGLRLGDTQAEVARELGISEEYLCRRWKPVLILLVRRRLEDQKLTAAHPQQDVLRAA